MGGVIISRRRFVAAGVIGTLGAVLAPETVFAVASQPKLLRWDLVNIKDGVLLAGGTDVGSAANGDTVKLTGSGEAQPGALAATGGGTFVHINSDEELVASGVYYVTGFKSFVKPGGSLAGVGVIDGIGTLDQTTGGELSVNIHAIIDAPEEKKGAMVDAVLGVHCELPLGDTTIKEGITLSVLGLNFVQAGGATLFHVLA